MAKTKKATVINATKELRKIRAQLETLKKQENDLKEVVKAYLLNNAVESLDTAECTAVLRKTPKFKVSDEAEALNMALMLHLPCLKVDGNKFKEAILHIDSNTDLSLYGKEVNEIAVRITYRKD